jgi:ergothioneine biosynthesis protein EgtB
MQPPAPPAARFAATRARSLALAASLSPEDQQIQAFPYASPTKWHLAHTTWFFETFLLARWAPERAPRHPGYDVLFNSYYEGVGARFSRPQRGLLSRPRLDEVHAWRAEVDAAVVALLGAAGDDPELLALLELGCAHEEQHQELLLTDILANLSVNPLSPAWREEAPPASPAPPTPAWVGFEGGLAWVGHEGEGFAFDNEGPRHRVFLEDFALRSTLLTNAEVLAFIEDGGYRDPRPWLSDGIAWVRENGVEAPRYWRRAPDGGWRHFTLYGERPLDLHAPATHLSAYEADAIATWMGARLPTEFEWEVAARRSGAEPARSRADGVVLPRSGPAGPCGLAGMGGEVWAWTRSAYAPYPGYRPAAGAVGEYNGKFMANQWVLRGSSCATTPGHSRPSYRNFFYLPERWQFTGVRLARA